MDKLGTKWAEALQLEIRDHLPKEIFRTYPSTRLAVLEIYYSDNDKTTAHSLESFDRLLARQQQMLLWLR